MESGPKNREKIENRTRETERRREICFFHLLQTNQSSTTISNHQNDHKLLIRNKKNKQNNKAQQLCIFNVDIFVCHLEKF
jgi:hypothetical protein